MNCINGSSYKSNGEFMFIPVANKTEHFEIREFNHYYGICLAPLFSCPRSELDEMNGPLVILHETTQVHFEP